MKTKTLILATVILLSACSARFSWVDGRVFPEQIKKAQELCENNGGWQTVNTLKYTNSMGNERRFFINLTCQNGAMIEIEWG